ncbi:MAG: hemolysin [Okeania sp. SIO1H6]|nr:hemolysin [Okeania sp. SIO1H6]
MTQPTAQDQYMLELINRDRADPQAAADLYLDGLNGRDGDLNEGVRAQDTISTDAKQPLAFNLNLNTAAQDHTQYLLDNNLFTHTGEGGTRSWQRMENAGYTFTSPSGSGENIAWSGTGFGTPNFTTFVERNYENLFIDKNYPDRGHRVSLMNPDFQEIGIYSKLKNGFISPFDGRAYNAVMSTQDFAYSGASGPFITGVAYTDAVTDDDFYTVGEGISGITVTAVDTANPANTFTTTTWDAGGYSLDVAPDATYEVTFEGDFDGDSQSDTATYHITVGSENVKKDLATDNLPTSSPSLPTSSDDNLVEDSTAEVIQALAGNDTVYGAAGNDTIGGGEGNDILYGEVGNDSITGWTGNDQLDGGSGNDTLQGGDDLDTLNGGDHADTLKGGNHADELNGDGGNDLLQGQAGNDILNGGDGDDTAGGGKGDDIIDGGAGNDYLTGWKGNDDITGGTGNDMIRGGTGNDIIRGGDGLDILTGVDTSVAQPGNNEIDTLEGGAGADLFILGNGQVYYDDNGTADYALLGTFNSAEGDRIQLSGNIDDYSFGENVSGLPAGTAIYTNSGSELIAVVDGVTGMNWGNTNTTGLSFV